MGGFIGGARWTQRAYPTFNDEASVGYGIATDQKHPYEYVHDVYVGQYYQYISDYDDRDDGLETRQSANECKRRL